MLREVGPQVQSEGCRSKCWLEGQNDVTVKIITGRKRALGLVGRSRAVKRTIPVGHTGQRSVRSPNME